MWCPIEIIKILLLSRTLTWPPWRQRKPAIPVCSPSLVFDNILFLLLKKLTRKRGWTCKFKCRQKNILKNIFPTGKWMPLQRKPGGKTSCGLAITRASIIKNSSNLVKWNEWLENYAEINLSVNQYEQELGLGQQHFVYVYCHDNAVIISVQTTLVKVEWPKYRFLLWNKGIHWVCKYVYILDAYK